MGQLRFKRLFCRGRAGGACSPAGPRRRNVPLRRRLAAGEAQSAQTKRAQRSLYDARMRTTPELWSDAVRDAPAGPAYLEETADGWRPVSWDEASERVSALAQGLLARGVRHGDRVAVLSRTRLEWILLVWAVMAIGAVVVGLYPTSSAKECEYILDHCEAVLAFTEDEEQTRKLVSVRGSLPNLREIIPFDWLEKLESDGRLARHLKPEPVEEDDLATLIYTSGTTGPPKGCMLNHRNLVTAAIRVVEGVHQPDDIVLLFLPLAHSYGRLAHQAATHRGATVALVADVARVPEALATVRPTVLPAVPRVYEKRSEEHTS